MFTVFFFILFSVLFSFSFISKPEIRSGTPGLCPLTLSKIKGRDSRTTNNTVSPRGFAGIRSSSAFLTIKLLRLNFGRKARLGFREVLYIINDNIKKYIYINIEKKL